MSVTEEAPTMALAGDYSVLAQTAAAEEGMVTGIIRNVGIGKRDTNLPVLWFDVYISEATSSLQILGWDDAHDIVARFTHIGQLTGYPCWCDVTVPGIVKFVRLWDHFGG